MKYQVTRSFPGAKGELPKVTVVTRTKDRPIMLRRSALSVLQQTYPDWLHVVVNDGGDPAMVDVTLGEFAARYCGRLKVVNNVRSIGMQNASNRALRDSDSDYVVIHDDDDSWHPDFLGECVRFLDACGPRHRCQGVITHTEWVFEEFNARGELLELSRRDFFPINQVSLFEVAACNRFPPIAFVYRRAAHTELGMFDQQFNVLGDWDWNLRFLSRYDIGVIPRKLAMYHWRHQSGANAYANTVTSGVSEHHSREVQLRNHYLRQDLAAGKAGLGYLLSTAKGSHQQLELGQRLEQQQQQTQANLESALGYLRHLTRISSDLTRVWHCKHFLHQARTLWREQRQGTSQAPSRAEMLARLNRLATSVQVLSLDVFDTAIHRLLRQPIDLFRLLQPRVIELLGERGRLFAAARQAAERLARDRAWEIDKSEDVTLSEIYDAFAESHAIDDREKAQLIELELQLELDMSYANPAILKLCRTAVAHGVRLIYVSDMYLTAEMIARLLAAHGFPEAQIYVSSEVRRTKYNGSMYPWLRRELGTETTEVLHLGDNGYSDVTQAQRYGLQAWHWPDGGATRPLVDQHVALTGADREDLTSSLYTGLVRRYRIQAGVDDHDCWQTLGYELAGPLYLAFVSWVAQQAVADGVRKLFFLGRDGYHLAQTFAQLDTHWQLPVRGTYMYASRRLFNLARITRLDEATIDFLITPNPGLTVRHFLTRVGLDAERYLPSVRQCGFEALDQAVTTSHGIFSTDAFHGGMRQLFHLLEPELLDRARAERERLLTYFESIGLAPGEIAIVDLGWQASSASSLQDLLRLQQDDFRLRGYYFGTWHFAQKAVAAGCRLKSFYFHLDEPRFRRDLVSECVELVEHLCEAPHPTVIGLRQQGAEWSPVYGESEADPSATAALARMSEAAMQFVTDALAVLPAPKVLAPPLGYLDTVFERVLRNPQVHEAQAFGQLAHRDSFGGNAPVRYLARRPGAWGALLRPQRLRQAHQNAYWKRGFMALLTESERQRLTTSEQAL